MTVAEHEPDLRPVREAEENLRLIRGLMERSTRHSTFSGLSGVLAGLYAIAGALAQLKLLPSIQEEHPVRAFICLWGIVVAAAIGTDFLLTKRRAARVGKYVRSHLGRQMIRAAGPGLLTGAALTFVLASSKLFFLIPPIWMLCYGSAVCSVGFFSQKEVSWLGWAFLAAGVVTVALVAWPAFPVFEMGIWMTAISFGGFHIVYGISVARRDGW
jgi:hypothetical protein